jgi:uncharacterized protein YdhG (YjbR/CyaY superfamily)
MKTNKKIPQNIDEYIKMFPEDIQAVLQTLRQTIRNAAPQAEETISYRMPAFKLNGILVFFAAFKNHIGFYPTSSATTAFKDELSIYKGGKGSVQFPIDKPLPLDLISKIVKYRVRENLNKK